MKDPLPILQASRNILLVDWPNPGVPRALLHAGFNVFCFSPNRYTRAEILAAPPIEVEAGSVFPPKPSGFILRSFLPKQGRWPRDTV